MSTEAAAVGTAAVGVNAAAEALHYLNRLCWERESRQGGRPR